MRTVTLWLGAAAVVAAGAVYATAARSEPRFANTFYGAPTAGLLYPLLLGSPLVGYDRYFGDVVSIGLGAGYSPEGIEGAATNGDLQWHHVVTLALNVKVFPFRRGRGFFISPEVAYRYSPNVEEYDLGFHDVRTDADVSPAILVGWRWLLAGDRLGLTLAPGVAFNSVSMLSLYPRLDVFLGVHF
jgi:hypothetical protein